MSSTMGDVSLIKDEDLLKKMWQESQDTEVRREIRTRMCRLREERLRDLYASPEGHRVILEIEGTGKATHTDSILDHSFTGMKRKEVRDSESPTKDISYGGLRGLGKSKDHGWEIMTSNERSDDGKYQKTTKQATTSGTEIIEKGKIDYSADCRQQASLYKDGDDKNYVKSSGSDSSSVIKQVATGGDENSKFSASSTHAESSSKSYTEKHSVSNDLYNSKSSNNTFANNDSVVRKVYTHDTPNELKDHPSYIDGNTRVTKETRTLSDGTVVTTTKYETIAKTKSTASQNYSSSSTTQHKSSTTSQSSHLVDQVNQNEIENVRRVKQIESSEPRQIVETIITPVDVTSRSHIVSQDSSKHTTTKHHVSENLDDQIIIKTNERCFNNTQQQPIDSRTQIIHETSDDSNRYDSTITSKRFDDSTTKHVEETTNQENVTRLKKSPPPYQEQPSQQPKRQPIKPPKSELDDSPKPTAGQYDTTYRTDYTNKKISVEVSPTHDAFARSLRSVTPERINKCSSPARGSVRTTSNSSLRSSTSPEKKYPSKTSPDRKPNYRESSPLSRNDSTDTYIYRRSPDRKSEIIKKERISSTHSLDTYNRNLINTTITRKKQTPHERSESPSPTKIYHVEYIRNINNVTTDLDTDETDKRNGYVNKKIETFRSTRPTSLEAITTTKKFKKVTDRSPTSPLKDCKNKSPLKEAPRRFSPSPTKSGGASPSSPHFPKDKTFRRRDTYEERCRQILGITEKNETRRESFEKTSTTKRTDTEKKVTSRKEVQIPRKGSPEKKIVNKKITEFPSQRKSPSPGRRTTTLHQETSETKIRDTSEKYVRPCSSRESSKSPSPVRQAPGERPGERLIEITKVVTSKYEPARDEYPEYRKSPDICEFPAQVRKSPERQPFEKQPEKERPYTEAPGISEFPAQVRRTPEREPLEKLPGKERPYKEGPAISEFPAQIRRTPEREPLEEFPQKGRPCKEAPAISEFPAQIRRTPEREPLEEFPQKGRPSKEAPGISEFPAQIRKTPEREPLEDLPQKKRPCKEAPTISEFPAQIRRTPDREPLEEFPQKGRPCKEAPTISEFPAQIRRTPEREPFEKLPEKERPYKEGPHISEFPAQIRRTPEREPLETLPEKGKPHKEGPKISEFPAQTRKSPERQPFEKLPEKERPHKEGPKISEFPAQIRKSPERQPLEHLPQKGKPGKEAPKIAEFPSQVRRSPEKQPMERFPEKERPYKEGPEISEFPAQTRKSPERQPLEHLPQKGKPGKEAPKIAEFPSQVKRSPEKQPMERFTEKERPHKEGAKISEFPSQTRKSPERQPLDRLPQKGKPGKEPPKIAEFPSQIRRSPEKQPMERFPEKEKPHKEGPKISEFPSQTRKSPERQPLDRLPQKGKPGKEAPKIAEFPSQVRRSPERQTLEKQPQKGKPRYESPKRTEFPAQTRRTPEKQPLQKPQEKSKPGTTTPRISEFPTQTRRSPQRQSIEKTQEIKTFSKNSHYICEYPTQERTTEPTRAAKKIPNQEPKPKHLDKQPSSKSPKVSEPIPVKQKQPIKKQRTTSSSSCEEEIATHEYIFQSETRVPVVEPLVTKKFVPLTYDDDDEPVALSEHVSQSRLEKEITKTDKATNKTVKKDSPERTLTAEFIINEKIDTDYNTNKNNSINQVVITDKKLKKPGKTEYMSEYCKTNTKTLQNGDITKKYITTKVKDIPDTRKQTPIKKIPSKTQLGTKTLPNKPMKKPFSETTQKIINKSTKTETTVKPRPVQDSPRHVVTTTITTTLTKTPKQTCKPTTPKSNQTKPYSTTSRPKLTNGHLPTDEEVVVTEKRPYSRTSKTPSRQVKPKQDKCITTKSIIITNDTEKEVIINLQRSQSSREATPDRICPLPVTSDDDHSPRYPDQITEPDDPTPRKFKPVVHQPILEDEDVDHFTETKRIITEVDKVDECDESLLSVDKKISKFLDTAEQLTKQSEPKGPAPKVERPILIVDKDLEQDECLLSVSDKVNKFISTAEQLTVSQTTQQERPKTPLGRNLKDLEPAEDEMETISIIIDDENVCSLTKPKPGKTGPATPAPAPAPERPKSPRFLNYQEEKPTTKKISTTVAERMTRFTTTTPVTNISKIEPNTQTTRKPHDLNTTTPSRKPPNNYDSIKDTQPHEPKRGKSPDLPESTPKSSRKPHPEEPKSIFRLRSTESIKRAKALFENGTKEPVTVNKPRDVSNRPLFESKKPLDSTKPHKDQDVCRIDDNEQRKSLNSRSFQEDTSLKSTKLVLQRYRPNSPEKIKKPSSRSQTPEPERDVPGYMKPFSRKHTPELERDVPGYVKPSSRKHTPEPERDVPGYVKPSSRKHTPEPERDVPGYMKPLDRSLRQHSPHRETVVDSRTQSPSLNHTKPKERSQSPAPAPAPSPLRQQQQPQVHETRFGVTLKKTDTGRTTTTNTTTTTTTNITNTGQKHRPSTSPSRASVDLEIEDIYEVDVLEYMLETATSYEVRRRVRAQIRLVKKLISENQLTSYIRTRKITTSSRTKERTTSPQKIKPTDLRDTKSPERKRTSPSPDHHQPRLSPDRRSKSPGSTVHHHQDTTILKKTTHQSKATQVIEEKPSWVTQRNLKKASERPPPTSKITTTRRAVSPPKRDKTTDLITSSYGVGPTDENGTPLFGLKALKAQKNSTTTKVQGTVVRSHYYSENGEEPVGEISYTKYSTDPKDLGCDDVTRDKGITSVTTTQKFGYKDTPNLQSLSTRNQQYQIDDASEISKTATRRNSVKALSEKFMETTTSTSTSTETSCKLDKQGSYPKAGLILRTSSFKDSTKKNDDLSGDLKELVTVQSSSRMTSGKETFLSNTSKVTGVQDVISRMKTEEVREGDTAEDVEARGLLNKFLGASVILAGMEGHITKTSTSSATASVSSCAVSKAVTKVTTTLMEGGKQVTRTRIFQHPVSEEELETVWDEETIRLLLENSTDYEERRRIRARLRQVMADKEACTELVDKASQEQSAGSLDEKLETTKKTVTQGPVTTTQVTTTKVSSQHVSKPISPFAKFRQLDKQNSLNTPPSTPKTPTSGGGPLFRFTDPALSHSASTIKERLLHWCRTKTREYENIQLDNFSSSWADGLAFCALIHHFIPDAFDYHALTPNNRRHNFTLAFKVADEKADIVPLLDVDDMLATRKPDWKCVFTYVQSIYRHFKDAD